MGDFLGQKTMSAFCQRNIGVFTAILRRARADSFARQLFFQLGAPMIKLSARATPVDLPRQTYGADRLACVRGKRDSPEKSHSPVSCRVATKPFPDTACI